MAGDWCFRGVLAGFSAALICVGLVAGCYSGGERSALHVERAREQIVSGARGEAIIELRSALREDPRNAEASELLANLLVREGRLAAAADLYRDAYAIDPERSRAAIQRAILIRATQPEEARALVLGVLDRDPDDAFAYVGKAELAVAGGQTAVALEAARRAVELAPEEPSTHWELAFVNQTRIRERTLRGHPPIDAHFEATLQALDGYGAAGGDPALAAIERARTLGVWPGHAEEAAAAHRESVERAVESGIPQHARRATQEALDFARDARDGELLGFALEQRVTLRPEEIASWTALARYTQRHGGSGLEVLERLLEERPDDPDAHIAYARQLVQSGRLDDALGHLESRVEAGVAPARLLAALANLNFAAQRVTDAERVTDRMRREHPTDDWTQLQIAQLELKQGRPQEARRMLRELTATWESAEAQRLLAELELRFNDPRAARRAIEKAVELEGRFELRSQRLLAMLLARSGEHERVLPILRKIERRGAASPSERLWLARALYETGSEDAGRAILEELLAAPTPAREVVVEFAAREGASPERRERTRALLDREYAARPDDAGLLAQLTELDFAQGETERALARLDAAIERNPKNGSALLIRAEIRRASGERDRAIADAQRALTAQPNLQNAIRFLVSLHLEEGERAEARGVLDQAERHGVSSPGLHALSGRLHMASGEDELARQSFEVALRSNADLPRVKNDLAFLLARRGEDLERAQRLAGEAVESLGADAEAEHTLGYVYLRSGVPMKAAEYFRLALRDADPPRPQFHYHMGLALQELGRHLLAAKEFEDSLALDPDFPEAEQARSALEGMRASGSSGDPS